MNKSISNKWNLIKKHGFLIYAAVMAILLVTYSIPDIIRHGITSDLFIHLFALYLLLSLLSEWLDTIGRKKLGNAMMFASLIPGIGGIISNFVFKGGHSLIPLAVIIAFFVILIIAAKKFQ
ncbi:MAG: hypothetical protein ACYC27_02810 [Armatimonadota bacterium]